MTDRTKIKLFCIMLGIVVPIIIFACLLFVKASRGQELTETVETTHVVIEAYLLPGSMPQDKVRLYLPINRLFPYYRPDYGGDWRIIVDGLRFYMEEEPSWWKEDKTDE